MGGQENLEKDELNSGCSFMYNTKICSNALTSSIMKRCNPSKTAFNPLSKKGRF